MRALLVCLCLSACDGGEQEVPRSLCEGGGELGLEIGAGQVANFTPFEDGEEVFMVIMGATDEGAAQGGLQMSLLTSGLDTTDTVSLVVRVRDGATGPSQDALGNVNLQCPAEGPGWTAFTAPLGESLDALDGQSRAVSVTMTDAGGVTTSTEITVLLRK